MSSYSSSGDRRTERELYGNHPWLLQPSYWALRVYRFGRSTVDARGPLGRVKHGVYFILYSWVRLATGIDIPRSVQVGDRLMIHHFGGVIVHPQAVLGDDCVLRHGVTIGERRPGEGVPTIGSGVVFGAYVQVLGPVHVGDGAVLAASSVVLRDVPSAATVAGIPARVIKA